MTPMQKRKFGKIVVGLFALSLVAVVGLPWVAHAVDEGSDPAMAAAEGEAAHRGMPAARRATRPRRASW